MTTEKTEYAVSLDNEERNEFSDNLSITGRVNGKQCAVVIKMRTLKGLLPKAQKLAKQKALINAFLTKKDAKEFAGEVVAV